jgi:hypothetical protein
MLPGMAKPSKEASEELKSLGFRCPEVLAERRHATARGLALDLSQLLRMMIVEHLPEYERRVEQAGRDAKR